MKLIEYLASAQRGTQQKLCNTVGATKADMSNWKYGKAPVPVHHCVQIERATNGVVARKDLRPDDWHLIWPELEDKNG